MLLALIANERAGSRTTRAALETELRGLGADVRCFGPHQLDDAVAVAPDRLVAAGGDGTIGAAAGAAADAGIPLAVIPAGTANDFARGLEIPADIPAACRIAVEGATLRRLELGRMDGRPFVNVASTGLAAEAAERAEALKPRLGPLAYLLGALWAGARSAPVGCRVSANGQEVFAGEAWQVIVAVSGRFGGGSSVDAADPDDGLLDVAVVPGGSRRHLPRYGLRMRSGAIADDPRVCHARGDSVRLDVAPREAWNVDGEVLRHGPAELTVERQAFAVVLP